MSETQVSIASRPRQHDKVVCGERLTIPPVGTRHLYPRAIRYLRVAKP